MKSEKTAVFKLKYEKPAIMKLGIPAKGTGKCMNGATDAMNCSLGSSANWYCYSGLLTATCGTGTDNG